MIPQGVSVRSKLAQVVSSIQAAIFWHPGRGCFTCGEKHKSKFRVSNLHTVVRDMTRSLEYEVRSHESWMACVLTRPV